MATSKPFSEGDVATRISAIYCSRPNAWPSPRPNLSFFRKPPKMRVSTNSGAEPEILAAHFITTWGGHRRAGDQHKLRNVAPIERQLRDALRVHNGRDRSVFRLDQSGSGFNAHDFRRRTYF